MSSQAQLSSKLIDELELFGVLRDEFDGEILDEDIMLDALACAGLALYEPETNIASKEFLERLDDRFV